MRSPREILDGLAKFHESKPEGITIGREEERKNTIYEKKRADEAEERANKAEEQVKKLQELLKKNGVSLKE